MIYYYFRFDSSSSGNDSEDDGHAKLQSSLAHSTERTLHASTSEEQENTEGCQEFQLNFKIGPESGRVRPRLPMNIAREKASLLGLAIVENSGLVDPIGDKDSDIDRSVQTAGTEEHSSFSEQAWDFYQVIIDLLIHKL